MKLLRSLTAFHAFAAAWKPESSIHGKVEAAGDKLLGVDRPVEYDGYKVFRLPVGDNVDRVNRVAHDLGLQTWRPAIQGGYADFAVHPNDTDGFCEELGFLKPTVLHQDLGASIARESSFDTFRQARSVDDSWFHSYHPWTSHIRFLELLAKKFPKNAEVFMAGLTAESWLIPGIHLYGKDGAGHNPAVVMHGTVHAREWITGMVVEYAAYTLLTGYGSDANLTRNLDQFDFYLFPVVNIDGFVWSQEVDRMWRKNRQPNKGSSCIGRDINRNWDRQWDLQSGASQDPCRETYKGREAGDASEVKVMAAYMQKIKKAQGVKMFIDFHSYSQLFMTPYAYSCDVVPENNDEYQSLANGAVAAIHDVHGTYFSAGPICPTIYHTSGNSVDWAADVLKADYAFSIELRDEGQYGFVLPPKQILPSGEEAFAGLRYLLDNVK